ncbi:MAG: hypothetical protein QXQ66_10020, partial [Candidatus Hadarchaeum sp.]
METQWYSRQQLEELQLERLKAIIKHAYENVPYYRRIFDERNLKPYDIKSKNDLAKLPLLTRRDLVENSELLKSRDFSRYCPTPSFTSGSTGEPVTVWLSRETRTMVNACVWRHWSWFGFRFGDKMAMLRAPQDYSSAYKSQMQSGGKDNLRHPAIFYDKKEN